MRVLILGINYWPEQTGIGPFTTGRAEHLAALGHEVTVVTGFPYYPAWRVADGYRGMIAHREERAGVRILRTWLWVPHRVTALSRIIHEGTFLASSLVRALGARAKPDVLMVVSPPLSLTVAAIALGRAWRRPFVLLVEDLQPDTALGLGMLSSGALARTLFALERSAYRNAAVVATLNDAIRRRVIAKGVAADKVAIASHWAEPGLFTICDECDGARFRRAAGLGREFIAVHAGNMGVKQGLQVIVDAAALTRERERLLYLMVGDGAMRPALQQRIDGERLANIRLLPLLARERFRGLLAASELGLVTQRRVVGDNVFPSKLETLMAAGRPVVASVRHDSMAARVLNESGAGTVVEPENPHALSQAIVGLMHDRPRRAEMARRGREYARDVWDRSRALGGFAAVLEGAALSERRAVRAPSQPAAPVAIDVAPFQPTLRVNPRARTHAIAARTALQRTAAVFGIGKEH